MKANKVAVINFSGNVGKTTVAGHLIAPRIDAPIISVESLNQDGSADGLEMDQIRAKRFGELQEKLMLEDKAVVDIGASNVEMFVKMMTQYAGSHEEFDAFVVPVVKEKKQQADSINTINTLLAIGVKPKQIRVVFNRVEPDDDIEDDFDAIFGLADQTKIQCEADAAIYANEVFEKLKRVGIPLANIVSDDTDYRGQLRTATSDEEKEKLVAMISLQRLAKTANSNLDRVFKALFA